MKKDTSNNKPKNKFINKGSYPYKKTSLIVPIILIIFALTALVFHSIQTIPIYVNGFVCSSDCFKTQGPHLYIFTSMSFLLLIPSILGIVVAAFNKTEKHAKILLTLNVIVTILLLAVGVLGCVFLRPLS